MPAETAQEVQDRRNEILAAMQNMATAAPEPGEVQVGQVVHAGDAGLDAQMIVSGIKGAGVMYIYDSRTGERSRTNRNMLPTQLSKKREDGSTVFTTTKPDFEPKRGTFKCMLHPSLRSKHPDYDAWGLPLCGKDNLPSRQEVKSHMMSRHKRQWATIEEDRVEQERQEDRRLQRETATATQAALVAMGGHMAPGEPAEPRTRGRKTAEGVA